MYTVSGTFNSIPYEVGIHPGADHGDEPGALGVMMGSTHVVNALRAHVGIEVTATPTSDPVTVDPSDAASVHAFLLSQTDVGHVDGADAPDMSAEDGYLADVY